MCNSACAFHERDNWCLKRSTQMLFEVGGLAVLSIAVKASTGLRLATASASCARLRFRSFRADRATCSCSAACVSASCASIWLHGATAHVPSVPFLTSSCQIYSGSGCSWFQTLPYVESSCQRLSLASGKLSSRAVQDRMCYLSPPRDMQTADKGGVLTPALPEILHSGQLWTQTPPQCPLGHLRHSHPAHTVATLAP